MSGNQTGSIFPTSIFGHILISAAKGNVESKKTTNSPFGQVYTGEWYKSPKESWLKGRLHVLNAVRNKERWPLKTHLLIFWNKRKSNGYEPLELRGTDKWSRLRTHWNFERWKLKKWGNKLHRLLYNTLYFHKTPGMQRESSRMFFVSFSWMKL